ncbi:MAG: hypothetical protein KF903_03430 [Dokdonella sp.]|uniref:hypothetical protein n=1 Tax=Dokdonella sp. TaxID=2291710 RepID=UPI0025B8C410|nr:hypothetical protein [Dokdonella sp.]MBX3700034.1 hypothetical protein [Dokdonella sp.]MCW5577477.1 hypothetical protein [Dokdonella sp.]
MRDQITQSPAPRRIGIATAGMCALAGGALWGLLALHAVGDLAPFAFVVAAVVAWTLRAHGYGGRPLGIVLAPVLVALAATYAYYLQAAARIAAMLGLPLREALFRMQASFALDIVRVNLSPTSVVTVALALVAAIAIMWPRGRR